MHCVLCIMNSQSPNFWWGLLAATCPYKWTVQITAWFNGCDQSVYRDFGVFVVIVHKTRETPNPDSPMKPPVYTWTVTISAWINGCDQIAKSHIAISGFSMSRNLTYPTRDPRNSDDYAPGPYDHYPHDRSQTFTPFKDLVGSHWSNGGRVPALGSDGCRGLLPI
jgi:hypothetical protein